MKSGKRSLTLSIAPEIDENVELTNDNNTKYETTISVLNPSDCSQHFQQLNFIWLFLANSKFASPSTNEVCK